MTEEQASEKYWCAQGLLEEAIESGHRGDTQEVLNELENDLDGVEN